MSNSHARKMMGCTIFTLLALLLTAMTGFLGGVPLRGLRLVVGSTIYWAVGLLSSAALGMFGMWALGLIFLSLVTVVGLFSELEERGLPLVSSAISSVIITTLMLAGGFAFWVSQKGATWYQILLNMVESFLATFPKWAGAVNIEAKEVLAQIPSMVIVVLIMGLFMALLFQRVVMAMASQRRGPMHRLSRFALPDSFIWVLVIGIGGTFLSTKWAWLQPLGMNLLNVAGVAFFLQGLAVVISYFATFKVGTAWQVILLVVLITQLFVLVAAFGLADFWIDFRSKFSKRGPKFDQEIFKK